MPLKRNTILACLTFIACSASLLAPRGAAAETLSQAVMAALDNHPTLEAAIASREAASYNKKEKFSDLFPKLNVRGAGGRIYGDNSTSRGLSVTRGAGYSDYFEGSVTMSQMLFDGFETYRRLDALEARRDAAGQNIIDSRETLAMEVVLTYFDILRGQETLAMMENHREKLGGFRERIRSMVESGAASETMAMQAQDIQVQLENTMANIKGQIAGALSSYRALTGSEPQGPLSLPALPYEFIPENIDLAVEAAKASHPMLQSAVMEEEATLHEAKAEEGILFPDFTGELSYLKRDQDDLIGGEVIDAKAVVRMNWNLSLGGGEIARIKNKKQLHYQSSAERRDIERRLEEEVRKSWADMQTAHMQLSLMNKRRQLNEELVATNKAQFEGSRVNMLQLMQAENALFNAKIALLNADYRYIAAQYKTLANIGRLQEALRTIETAELDR